MRCVSIAYTDTWEVLNLHFCMMNVQEDKKEHQQGTGALTSLKFKSVGVIFYFLLGRGEASRQSKRIKRLRS